VLVVPRAPDDSKGASIGFLESERENASGGKPGQCHPMSDAVGPFKFYCGDLRPRPLEEADVSSGDLP